MPGGVLVSGPAGAGKSQVALRLLRESTTPAVIIDFQPIYAQLLGILRNSRTGRFPERKDADSFALRIAESARRAQISAAVRDNVRPIVTNSDGSPTRRAQLLNLMGSEADEQIVDPGIEVVRDRLSVNGELSEQCQEAIGRWYDRLGDSRHILMVAAL